MNERDDMHNRPGDFALDEPLPLGAAEPVDVVQVRADDALVAALGLAEDVHVDDPIDERLAGLLRSWRDDVHDAPAPPLLDVGAAMAAMTSAPRVRRQSRPASPFGPLATAAAVLVIAFIGLGLAARGAEPGDALWNVTKVLYSDKARSVQAAVTVRAKLDEASKAYQTGDVGAAMAALQEAQKTLNVVSPEDGKAQLETQAEQLMAMVGTTPNTVPEMTTAPAATTTTTSVLPTEPSTSAVSSTPPPTTTAVSPSPTTTTAPTTTDVSPTVAPGEATPAESRSGKSSPPSRTKPSRAAAS